MDRVTGGGRTGETGEVTVPSRRAFLGIGAGCAIPVLAGVSWLRADRPLPPVRGGAAADPVWAHLAAEAQRLLDEVEQRQGPQGEHLRRLASQLGLFAAHLRGGGVEAALDAEVRRLVRDRGKDAAAWDVIDLYRSAKAHIPSVRGRRGRPQDLVHEAIATSLEDFDARGAVKVVRSWRPRLERIAARLDRDAARASASLRGATATLQKPGDDFQGFPEPELSHEEACRLLNGMTASLNLMIAISAAGGWEPVAAALGIMSATMSLVENLTCYEMAY